MRLIIILALITLSCSKFTYGVKVKDLLKREPIEQHIKTPKQAFKNMFQAAKIYVTGKDGNNSTALLQTQLQKKEQKKLFGYELDIEYLQEPNPEIHCTPNRPTLYFHGWGSTKNSGKVLKKYLDVLPGDVITFNFPDAHGFISRFLRTSFGQLPEVLAGLYVLKYAKDTLNLEAIDLFGISRGGAVVVNLIAVLNDKTGKYDDDLLRIGINAQERKELLQIIQNGCIVLNCSLIDMNVTLKYRFPRAASFITKIGTYVTQYNPDGLQALDSANNLDNLRLNILIHFQHNDRTVSNHYEAEFYQRMAKHRPKTTYLVLGNDGGHVHSHTALCKTIHTFRKQHGSSYDPEHDKRYSETIKPDTPIAYPDCLLQPGAQAEECIAAFHQFCRHECQA